MSRAGYLGLGSNVGDRRANLQAAVDALPGHGVDVLAVVLGLRDRAGRRAARPARLLQRLPPDRDRAGAGGAARRLQGGRARARAASAGGVRHGPRPIDVDLLLLGDETYRSERLSLPHEQVTSRRFVLVPLLELAPDLGAGRRPRGRRARPARDDAGVRLAGPRSPSRASRG